MKKEKSNKLREYVSEDVIEYVLWGGGALLFVYVSGLVMKLLGDTANSFKYMSNSFRQ
jgi:hypothetical protein